MKRLKEINTIICGVGGQGNILVERILGISAIREGYPVRGADTFGAAQRGGSVLTHIRFGTEVSSSLIPRGKCHILLGLEPIEALRTAIDFLQTNGLVILNTSPVLPASVKIGESAYPSVESILKLLNKVSQNVIQVDAANLAKRTAQTPRAMNIVMTGVLMALDILPFSIETVKQVLEQETGQFGRQNLKAFQAGLEIGEQKQLSRDFVGEQA
jgi:indolepyruvate ferredoxin oxidoreductase beta subunit